VTTTREISFGLAWEGKATTVFVDSANHMIVFFVDSVRA